MPTLSINGARYFVEQHGDGPPLLLLHGFTGSGRSWQPLFGELARHRRVITVDLPGHGRTVMPHDLRRFTMQAIATDLSSLLHELDCPETALLGYSMGGRLALHLALHAPDRFTTLILESASPGLKTMAGRAARAAADEQLALDIETAGIASFVDRWERLPLFDTQRTRLTAAEHDRLRRGRLSTDPSGLANSLRGMGTGVQPSLWPQLGETAMPVLLIAGEEDAKFAAIAGEMANEMPSATLALVPDAGHTVHLEQKQAYLKLLMAWLDDQGGDQLARAEKADKDERGQRHLLEPRIEGGQLLHPVNGQPVADEQRHGQQEQQIPARSERQRDVKQREKHGAAQE